MEQAYRVLCRAVQGSRRHLPTFEGVQYHFVECDLAGDLGNLAGDLGDLPGDLGDLPEGGAAASEAEAEATAGAAESARQLQAAVGFIAEAMRGGGTVLLHRLGLGFRVSFRVRVRVRVRVGVGVRLGLGLRV